MHHLEDVVFEVSPRLHSTLSTIKSVRTLRDRDRRRGVFDISDDENDDLDDVLNLFDSKIHGHLASVENLEKRAQELIKLVGYLVLLATDEQALTIDHSSARLLTSNAKVLPSKLTTASGCLQGIRRMITHQSGSSR